MRRARLLLPMSAVAILTACAGLGAPRVDQPSTAPQPIVRDGDFTLEITSPRDSWAAGEPIEVTATLTYERPGSTTIIGPGAGPIAFGVRQLDGTREMGALMTADAVEHVVGPEPYVAEYRKSGGWDPGDENEEFYKEFFEDPEFRLPPGRWEVTARAWFRTTEGGRRQLEMIAGLVLTVA
jgi:hypothetical protein